MRQVWNFIRLKGNRERLAWLGGGATIVIAGLWAAFVYFVPPNKTGGGGGVKVEASCGSVAVGGSVTGSTVTAGGAPGANCPPKKP